MGDEMSLDKQKSMATTERREAMKHVRKGLAQSDKNNS